ncbi:MAG: hypothetical protein BGN86_08010 [Caulobacterales bacterium 68-7]|nr:DsbA family protein [Caulobacterales bacterium]OJU07749.1 MAG: hypothetical protein BGN86_08010 [Caulobacterales bacterium 68-7]
MRVSRLVLSAALGATLLTGAASAQSFTVAPDDMTLGAAKAKVTVIEYASTACPHCAAWHSEVWPAFKKKYVDTGKVTFVYREFITSPPALAVAGPALARCAAANNNGGKAKYFAVIDKAFDVQAEIYGGSDARAALLKAGQAGGLTEAQFDACLTSQANFDAVTERVQNYAERDKIDSTPTFVVNGKKIEGEQDLASLDAAIAAAGK